MSDSRVKKYIDFFSEKKISYKIIGWNKKNKEIELENCIFFNLETKDNLKDKAMKSKLKWMYYVFKNLYIKRDEYKVIHCCDLDTVLPAIPMKLFGKKIIFDIFDWFSDTIILENKKIENGIKIFEKLAFRISDYVIICEEERKAQIGIEHKNLFVLPNIPTLKIEKKIDTTTNLQNKEKVIISYVGGFYENRNLEILINSVTKIPDIELKIAGYGDEKIEKLIVEKEKECHNIKFYGKVNYQKALEIMLESDLIYAMYCKKNPNHIFAAPNKFYESLMLGKPIITTEGTLVGEKVKKYNTGFVIGETAEDTEKVLVNLSLQKKEIEDKIKNCNSVWENEYKDYVENFLEKKYIKKIIQNL